MRRIQTLAFKLFVIVAIMMVFSILVACNSFSPFAGEQTIPSYPDAQDITIQNTDVSTDEIGVRIYKITSFTSVDAPDVILGFYRDQLEKGGWQPSIHNPGPNSIAYVLYAQSRSGPMDTVNVSVQSINPAKTTVVVKLGRHPGY